MKQLQPPTLILKANDSQQKRFVESLPLLSKIKEIAKRELNENDSKAVGYLIDSLNNYYVPDINSEENKAAVRGTIALLRMDGMSFAQIAEWLNNGRYKTSRSKFFHPTTVQRLLNEYNSGR